MPPPPLPPPTLYLWQASALYLASSLNSATHFSCLALSTHEPVWQQQRATADQSVVSELHEGGQVPEHRSDFLWPSHLRLAQVVGHAALRDRAQDVHQPAQLSLYQRCLVPPRRACHGACTPARPHSHSERGSGGEGQSKTHQLC